VSEHTLATSRPVSAGRPRTAAVAGAIALALALLTTATSSAAATTFKAVGSAEQVYAVGLAPAAQASLLSPNGNVLYTADADPLGGLLFRNVPPGTGYRVRLASDGSESPSLTVHSDAAAPWDPSIYNATIRDSGYGYLITRDGTTLAIDVHPPIGVTAANPGGHSTPPPPPWPTVIEYSGYGYADPSGPQNGIAILANLMGIAVVDVNMRGTGCSGGAFNFFEPLQNLDAYDVIETIAHQSWVLDHKVGMIGISYGGISQLFAAQLDPPDLEAIAPFSVIDATASTLYPGGILNTGFAVPWAEGRQSDAEPAGPNTGEGWAYQRIQNGDKTCAANQDLHGEAQNLLASIEANTYYNPAVADPLDPVTFVDKIKVPVFMACQWQDEQTGGHCAELAEHMTGTTKKWFTFTNGAHIDALDPATFDRWYDFMQLFVAHAPPEVLSAHIRGVAPLIYQQAMGLPSTDKVTLPVDPIQSISTYSAALSAFEALPEIRVLFDNGAGTSPSGATTAGDPYPGYELDFSSFPVAGTIARSWYLGPGGALTDTPPSTAGSSSYTSNANALPLTDYAGNTGGGGLWGNSSQWQWNWEQNPAGSAISFITAPLARNTTVIGGGAVDLWVRSSTPDVDLQATVSEVSATGNETFVQDGWLRASERKLSSGTDNVFKQPSSPVQPIPSFTKADAKPMPAGQYVLVVIPLYFSGHAYRAGTRIRVTISAPNGTQPVWSFSQTEPPTGTSTVSVAFSSSMPSRLVLPVVPGLAVPTPQPPCASLRNEPCRTYVPAANQG
jgi:predicted acyl esterase/uncharacterized membrane protein